MQLRYTSLLRSTWTYIPEGKERRKLAMILQHDVKLYNKAKEIYERNFKGWKP